MIYSHILDTIGRTPVIQLNHFESKKMFVKMELFNPGGSVKDRPAVHMIQAAEKQGILKKGMTIVEPTSGNTGIGLALVSAVKGYKTIFTMPESMTIERRKILEIYGAEIILTPAKLGMIGAIEKAELLADNSNFFMPSQFDNIDNVSAHKLTAQEIWEDFGDELDVLVVATGTGGTLTGIGKILSKKNPNLKIIAIEPEDSPVLSGGVAAPHKIAGMGPGFIPSILDKNIYDAVISVSTNAAYEMTRRLPQKEGLFVGISSGAVVWTMEKISKKYPEKTILGILPDTGERYLSSDVFKI